MEKQRKQWPFSAVQSVLCGVVVLATLGLRFWGGGAWATVCATLMRWLYAS